MDALQKTSTFNTGIIPRNGNLIVGLSGGPDSVYLLHQLLSLKNTLNLTLHAVHLDHEWRPCSAGDALFCKQLCEKLTVPFTLVHSSEIIKQFPYNGSKEALGREIRRSVFETICKQKNADAIVLAHHLDDQQETFFINLIRGASLPGLCAMKAEKDCYLRPMLALTKSDILEHLTKHKISYCIDPTNNDAVYLRNRIRQQVLPAFFACDKRAQANFARTIEQLREIEDFLQAITKDVLSQVIIPQKTKAETKNFVIKLEDFFQLPEYLQTRSLNLWMTLQLEQHRMSEAFIDEIVRFLKSPRGGTHQLSPDWSLVKKNNQAFIVFSDQK